MAARDPFQRMVYTEASFDLPGIFMFGRYQNAASDVGLRPHSHLNAIEICFLERGEQTYRVGGLAYRLRGSDQFFTLPGEVHDTANLPQERGILYWLILTLESRKKFLGLAEPLASRLKRELRRMPTRHFRGHPECSSLLGEIIDLLPKRLSRRKSSPDPLRQLRLQSLILQYLTLTVEASRRGMHGAASPLMQRVLQYIEKHLDEPVHVPRLAEIARLSESRFKARFKREMGVPPAEFWLRQKITRASILLKTQNVTEVAHALGFSSSQYFATVFKRYTLESPSRFRPRT
jgi:AraC-like DNA-binding protein